MRRSSTSVLALILGLGIYGLGPIVTKFELFGSTPAEAKSKHLLLLTGIESGGTDDPPGDDHGNDNDDGNDDNGGDDNDGGGDHHDGGDDHGSDDHGNDGDDDSNDN